MSKPYYFKSGIIAINYAMLVDRFYGQQEGFKDDAKYLIKYLKKFMKKCREAGNFIANVIES